MKKKLILSFLIIGLIIISGCANLYCTDDCSFGQKMCLGNTSYICGDYDDDSCMDWKKQECEYGCSNSICDTEPCKEDWKCDSWSNCENGQQTITCLDSNNCETTLSKPLETQSCEYQNLTDPDSIIIDKSDPGKCFNNRGVVCGGKCFVPQFETARCIDGEFLDGSAICFSNDDCYPGYICSNHNCGPVKEYLSFSFNIPKSLPSNEEFEFTVDITNELTTDKTVKFNKISFGNQPHAFGDYYENEITDDSTYHLKAGETKKLSYTLKTGPPTLIGYISLTTDDYLVGSREQIIVYDKNIEIKTCNGITYNPGWAVCDNEVLYPVGPSACQKDADCYSNRNICHEYICIINPIHHRYESVGLYEIPIIPIYRSEGSERDIQKQKAPGALKNLVIEFNNWIKAEKQIWNNDKFSVISHYQECAIEYSRSDFIEDMKKEATFPNVLDIIAQKCQVDDYLIVVFYFIGPNDYDSEVQSYFKKFGLPTSAGINFDKYIMMGSRGTEYTNEATFPVLTHEIFHSFGMIDMYPRLDRYSSRYHHRDCTLYKANWYTFNDKPLLCPFEAYIIGFNR